MKKLAAICLLAATLHARADMVLVEHVETDGKSMGDVTIKIKGDKARIDASPPPQSRIIELNTGDTITLLHADKSFVKAPAHLPEGNDKEAPKIVDTGRKEKMGDYNAEVYTAESGGTKYTFWVTKEVPNGESTLMLWKKFAVISEKLERQEHRPNLSTMDGIVVKMKLEGDSQSFSITVTSLKAENVPDSEFVTPADYKKAPESPAPEAPQQ